MYVLLLFIARFQFFRFLTVLFIDRLKLFISRPQLFVGGIGFLTDSAQPGLRKFQFLGEPSHGLIRSMFVRSCEALFHFLAFDEHDHSIARLADFVGLRRLYLDQHAMRLPVETNRYRQTQARQLLLEDAVQSRAQFKAEFRTYQIDDVACQGAPRWLQEPPGVL